MYAIVCYMYVKTDGNWIEVCNLAQELVTMSRLAKKWRHSLSTVGSCLLIDKQYGCPPGTSQSYTYTYTHTYIYICIYIYIYIKLPMWLSG